MSPEDVQAGRGRPAIEYQHSTYHSGMLGGSFFLFCITKQTCGNLAQPVWCKYLVEAHFKEVAEIIKQLKNLMAEY